MYVLVTGGTHVESEYSLQESVYGHARKQKKRKRGKDNVQRPVLGPSTCHTAWVPREPVQCAHMWWRDGKEKQNSLRIMKRQNWRLTGGGK